MAQLVGAAGRAPGKRHGFHAWTTEEALEPFRYGQIKINPAKI
jgi:hypothetical protein